ncbi:MAG: OadG family protein [Spirochaetales bacterium]|nr:OadG family protein [Spirochaetales bacterium]
MNVELYSYSLFTTVLGMLVVFLSLTMLSVMMVVLKAVFSGEEKPKGGRRPKDSGMPKAREAAQAGGKDLQPESGASMPLWVPVAVAAYLAEQEEPEHPTADPWNALVNQYDPWITGGRSIKRGV